MPSSSSSSYSSSNTEAKCTKKTAKSFDEAWSYLRTAFDRIVNQLEGVNDSSSFTSHDYMSYYTTVYELCTDQSGHENAKLLYSQFKKAVQDYVNSTVLPSLRGKKDEILLRELVRRWSNHKTMTYWLFRFFRYIDRYDLPRLGLPSVEETCYSSFYDLVYDEINQQVVVTLLSMSDRERAGEQIDRTLLYNTLAVFSEIGDSSTKNHAQGFAERLIKDNTAFHYDAASSWIASSSFKVNTPKEEKSDENPIISSKKINLVSSDGDVFEVDYKVASMSRTIEDLIKANPAAGDSHDDSIPLSLVRSKVLAMVIEFCKKHTESSGSHNDNEQSIFDVDLIEKWDAEFVEVDQQTLFDLVLASNYLNIKSLLDLSCNKIADMIRGKTPSEIRKMFNIKDDFVPEEEQELQRLF